MNAWDYSIVRDQGFFESRTENLQLLERHFTEFAWLMIVIYITIIVFMVLFVLVYCPFVAVSGSW